MTSPGWNTGPWPRGAGSIHRELARTVPTRAAVIRRVVLFSHAVRRLLSSAHLLRWRSGEGPTRNHGMWYVYEPSPSGDNARAPRRRTETAFLRRRTSLDRRTGRLR